MVLRDMVVAPGELVEVEEIYQSQLRFRYGLLGGSCEDLFGQGLMQSRGCGLPSEVNLENRNAGGM